MYYFIINPHSRGGHASAIWEDLRDELEKKHISYQSFITEYPGHAIQIASSLSRQTKEQDGIILIIVGGDGTLSEVINGLAFSPKITLGYIPTGSGNDFARSMRLPRDPKKALLHILSPKYHQYLDYGIISYPLGDTFSCRRFGVSCGIGFDADVCTGLETGKLKSIFHKLHIGKLIYVIMGIHKIIHIHHTDGILLIDGVKQIPLKKISFISAHIHRFEGGGFAFAPNADPSDGLLEVCVVSQVSRLRFIPILLLALLGGRQVGLPGVSFYRCRDAEIRTVLPLPVHADGEPLGNLNKFTVSCVSRQIKIARNPKN